MSDVTVIISLQGQPGANGVSGLRNVRSVTTAGPVQLLAGDEWIAIRNGVATVVILTAAPTTGQTVTVKDSLGVAAAAPITVQPYEGLIDGQASWTLTDAYGAVGFFYDGAAWSIL